MSDYAINLIVAAALLLFISALWMALQSAKKANQVSTMAIMERILGQNHPEMIDLLSGLLPVDGWSIDQLLKALRVASTDDMNEELIFQQQLCLEKFLEEIKLFGDRVITIRAIKAPAEKPGQKQDAIAAVLRVWKGQKFFSVAYRVKKIGVVEANVPEHLKRFIKFDDKNNQAFMHVVSQGAALVGTNGYSVKADFIDSLQSLSGLPQQVGTAISTLMYHRFDMLGGDLYTKPIFKSPSQGYISVYNDRELVVDYHGNKYVVTQQKALDIVANIAIAQERATIILDGAPNSGKTAFQAFLQEALCQNPNVNQVVLGNNDDLRAFIGLEGRSLQTRWAEQAHDQLNVVVIDDAVGILEDPTLRESLASFMDGQMKNQLNLVLVLSINRSLDDVPVDLKRPGRMSVTVHFPRLTGQDAKDLVTELESKIKPPKVIEDRAEEGKTYEIGEVFDWITNKDFSTDLREALEESNKVEKKEVNPVTKVAEVSKSFARRRGK
jgi:hypothetical protein